MTIQGGQTLCVKQGLVIFFLAVVLNYIWEVAQAPLYVGLQDWSAVWWHCFVAALGDGILIWIILVVGWAIFKRFDWYVFPTSRMRVVLAVTGLCIGIGIEWVAVNILGRWAYAPSMPILPILDIGLIPVLQMLVLPPLIFHIGARWSRKGSLTAVEPRSAVRD